jgi:diguanylate cyclase (GGDEF)-like protein
MGLAPGQPNAWLVRARWPGTIRAWPVWGLEPRLRRYVIGVIAAGAAAIGSAAAFTVWRGSNAVMFVFLLAIGAITVEAIRRLGEPAGASKDAHGLWELSIALLLPPFYAMIAPIAVMLLTQWRVRRTIAHRRVFSAAAIGLSYGAASLLFHAVWHHSSQLPDTQTGLLAWGVLAAASAILRWAVNNAMVLTAVKLDDPAARIRDLLGGRDSLWNDVAELCVGVLVAFSAATGPVLLIFALPCGTLLQRSARHAQLLHSSRIDAQTGLLSPVTWEREAAVQVTRAVRAGSPLAVAMVHIDHFTAVKDSYGHAVSDQVLREVAHALVGGMRGYDLPGRFGREEFIVLLAQADANEALFVAELLRARISEIIIPTGSGTGSGSGGGPGSGGAGSGGGPGSGGAGSGSGPGSGSAGYPAHITVSIGVAALADTIRDLTDLLTAADAALHWAKRAGDNSVRFAGLPPPAA